MDLCISNEVIINLLQNLFKTKKNPIKSGFLNNTTAAESRNVI